MATPYPPPAPRPTRTSGLAIAIPSFMDYMQRSKNIESTLMLRKLERSAQRYAMENNALPTASAPLTPATPCCDGPGHRCNDPQSWQAPAWQALDFQIDEPHQFQYSYESDGKTFTARAVGDPSCRGRSVSYELRGVLGDAGAVTFTHHGPVGRD